LDRVEGRRNASEKEELADDAEGDNASERRERTAEQVPIRAVYCIQEYM
jgi:hypothetical protein